MATRTITLSDIPEAVYERLREDAEHDGVSIADFVRRDLIERTPTGKIGSLRDWIAWLDTLEPLRVQVPPGAVLEALHAGRAERY